MLKQNAEKRFLRALSQRQSLHNGLWAILFPFSTKQMPFGAFFGIRQMKAQRCDASLRRVQPAIEQSKSNARVAFALCSNAYTLPKHTY
jgi:hypothetical protein